MGSEGKLTRAKGTFQGTSLEEFIAHFDLISMQSILKELNVSTLDGLLEILSQENLVSQLKVSTRHEEIDTLLNAVKSVNLVISKSEESPIPYSLRSGNKKRSHKRKQASYEAEVDPRIQEARNKKKCIRVLSAQLRRAASLDLVILLDCTSSMSAYLYDIQTHMSSLVSAVGQLHPDSSLRLAFVGYHHVSNHIDPKKQYIQRFTRDVTMFSTALQKLYTSGGGYDKLADVAGGLQIVSELDWRSTTRILFHIGDMPCHGSKYHDDRLQDNFPAGDPNGVVVQDALKVLFEANVKYYFGRLTGYTDKMVEVFNEHFARFAKPTAPDCPVARELSGRRVEAELLSQVNSAAPYEDKTENDCDEDEVGDAFADKEKDERGNSADSDCYVKAIDVSDPTLLLCTITGKVTESMTTSLSTSYTTLAAVGDLEHQLGGLNIRNPQWRQLAAEPGKLHDIPSPEKFSQLLCDPSQLLEARLSAFLPISSPSPSPTMKVSGQHCENNFEGTAALSITDNGSMCLVQLDAEPFARGSCRNAYKARVTLSHTTTSLGPDTMPKMLRSGALITKRPHLTTLMPCPVPQLRDLPGIVKLPLQSSRRQTNLVGEYAQALQLQHTYSVAHYLAVSFNSELQEAYTNSKQPQPSAPTIVYNPVTLLHLPERQECEQFATVERDITLRPTSAEMLRENIFLQSLMFNEGPSPKGSPPTSSYSHAICSSASATAAAPDQLHIGDRSTATKYGNEKSFEKYNGNHGLCLPIPTPHGTDHSIIQAFSHWSYKASKRELMVVDCQGVFHTAEEGRGGTFILTDPAVHCNDVLKFGGTNLGTEGFRRFFSTHRCNHFCVTLGLTTFTA